MWVRGFCSVLLVSRRLAGVVGSVVIEESKGSNVNNEEERKRK